MKAHARPSNVDAAEYPDGHALPFGEMIEGFIPDEPLGVDRRSGHSLHVDRVRVDLPVEIDVHVDDDGRVRIRSSPPSQHVKTSVMPVFHQMRLTIVDTGDT